MTILKKQLDNRLLTQIVIHKEDIHISFLKSFPYGTIELRDILIKSPSDFATHEFSISGKDTLLFARKISLTFNLKSIFTSELVLKKLEIRSASMNLLQDSQGRSNFDILKRNRKENLNDTFSMSLNDIEIRDMYLFYQDKKNSIISSGRIEKAQLSGSFRESDFRSKIQVASTNTCLSVNTKRILQHSDLLLTTNLQKKGSLYTFSDGSITLFGIRMSTRGNYESSKGTYGFVVACSQASFQKLDNDVFTRYFKDAVLKPYGGNLNFRFTLSGMKTSRPQIAIDFLLQEGIIKHKAENIKAEKIFIRGNYSNGKLRNKRSGILNIDSMYMKTKGSELSASGSIMNFVSPSVQAKIKGIVGLSELHIIKSLKKKVELGGSVQAEVNLSGSLPRTKNLKTNDLQQLGLQGFLFLDKATVTFPGNSSLTWTFSGKIDLHNASHVSFENLHLTSGRTDLQLRGGITNLPFFITDRCDFPVISCEVRSQEFHYEDLIGDPDDGDRDSLHIRFPDSLVVHADILLNSFEYGKFQATNITGNLSYHPKTIEIRNFSMQSQGGEISSEASVMHSGDRIILDCLVRVKHVNIGNTFYVFNEFGQTVITHEYLKGICTGNAAVTAEWDVYMNPLYDRLKVQSDFIIENGELINYQPLLGLSDFIKVEELRHIRFESLHANIQIRDRKATLNQTQINSSAISLTGSGEHDFDNNYKYRLQVHLADVLWKKAKKKKPQNTEFGYIVDEDYGRTILPLIITGKDTVFVVGYDKRTAGSLFEERVIRERQQWKELVSPDSSVRNRDQNFRLEWEDDSSGNLPDDTYREPGDEKEFQIEWEDE